MKMSIKDVMALIKKAGEEKAISLKISFTSLDKIPEENPLEEVIDMPGYSKNSKK